MSDPLAWLDDKIEVDAQNLLELCKAQEPIFIAVKSPYAAFNPSFFEGVAKGLYTPKTMTTFLPFPQSGWNEIPDLLLESPAGVLRLISVDHIAGWTKCLAYPNLTLDDYADHWQRVTAASDGQDPEL